MPSYNKQKDLSVYRFEGKVIGITSGPNKENTRYLIKEIKAGEYLGFIYPDYILAEFVNEHVSLLMVVRKKFTEETIVKRIAKNLLPKKDKE